MRSTFISGGLARTLLIISILVLVTFVLCSILRQNLSAVVFVGWVARLFPAAVVLVAVLWRLRELTHYFRHGAAAHQPWAKSVDLLNYRPSVLVAVCILSVLTFEFAVVGTLGGVTTYHGFLAKGGALGGSLMFADPKQYYGGALEMVTLGELSGVGGRRPIHPTLLSFYALLSGFDRIGILLLQAAFVGLSLAAAAIALARLCGVAAAAATWGLVALLAMDYVPTFMTASTGLAFGCLSFVALTAAVDRQRIWIFPLAAALLLLAFSARAGALFMVPALLACGIFPYRKVRRDVVRYVGLTVVFCALVLAIPKVVYLLYDTQLESFQGNLGFVLYEFAVDGDDWAQVRRDFPEELKALPREEHSNFIYARAKEAFLLSPGTAVSAYLKRLKSGTVAYPELQLRAMMLNFLDRDPDEGLTPNATVIAAVFYYASFLVLLLTSTLSVGARLTLLALFVAFVLALPMTFVEGGVRYHAATWLFSTGFFAMLLARRRHHSRNVVSTRTTWGVGVFCISSILVVAVVSRLAAAYLFDFEEGLKLTDAMRKRDQGPYPAYVLLGPQTPYLRLLSPQGQMLRPDISIDEFLAEDRMQRADMRPYFGKLKPGMSLLMGTDPRTGVHRYFVTEEELCIPDDRPRVFIATIEWLFKPHSYRMHALTLHDSRPDFENGISNETFECQ